MRLMGVYSSIKTTVKVVVTTEQRGDSSDQELLVSSTLLSTEDRARVSLYSAPVHVTACSSLRQNTTGVLIGNHTSTCGSGIFPGPMMMTCFSRGEEASTCSDDTSAWEGKETHPENCISTSLAVADSIATRAA